MTAERDGFRFVLGALQGGEVRITAGFLKLPEISAADVTLHPGETVDLEALLTTYIYGDALPEGYEVRFGTPADETVAVIAAGPAPELAADPDEEGVYRAACAITGVAEGETTVTVYGRNAAGDEVETTLQVTVVTDPITVKANSLTDVVYDGTEKTVSGFETLTFTFDGVTYTVEGLTAEASAKDAGVYPVEISGEAKVTDPDGHDMTARFEITYEAGTLSILPAALTLKADDQKKTAGTADPAWTVTAAPEMDLSGIQYTVERDPGETAGTSVAP